jgi:hypothetical protein
VNGDSKSTTERDPSLVGSLDKRFLSCLGCSSQPSTKYYFPHRTLFHFISPLAQQPGKAGVLSRMSLCLCAEPICVLLKLNNGWTFPQITKDDPKKQTAEDLRPVFRSSYPPKTCFMDFRTGFSAELNLLLLSFLNLGSPIRSTEEEQQTSQT